MATGISRIFFSTIQPCPKATRRLDPVVISLHSREIAANIPRTFGKRSIAHANKKKRDCRQRRLRDKSSVKEVTSWRSWSPATSRR
jgi:hypothetical protein